MRTEDQRTPHARFLSQMAQQELKGVIQNEILARRLKREGFEGCGTGDIIQNYAFKLVLSFL